MAVKHDLLVIVSKTSGSQEDIQPQLEAILAKTRLAYKIVHAATPPEVAKNIQKNSEKYQAIAVYGGDGSVVSAIKALVHSEAKLLILPGGTANVIASDLNLPSEAVQVLEMYIEGRYTTEYYDIASANKDPFVLDMHFGVWSEAIKNTPRSSKKKLGAAAYGLSALKQLPTAERKRYDIGFDGKKRRFNAYTVLIANQGFQNFLGIPLFSRKHHRGVIQVAVVKSLNPLKFLLWLLGKSVGVHNFGGAIATYRGNQVTVHKAPKSCFYDDFERTIKLPFTIKGGEYQTKIIVSAQNSNMTVMSHFLLSSQLIFVRFKERFRSFVSGRPRQDYTQFAPYVYVGGTYRKAAYKQFKKWGVTGIVNMRHSVPAPAPLGFEILHLKTRDWTPPSLESLTKGVEFIQSKVTKGEGVYVHCRQGEGRGPTMAAAYLISQGLTVEESLSILKKARPMAHPNRAQVQRLVEWSKATN